MKKTALVLALGAAFAGTAMAQSSVTLYGRINTSIDSQSFKGARNEQSINGNGSRLGFRGVENLATGVDTIFGIEVGINSESSSSASGNAGAIGFNRNTYVGLKGNSWGGVAIGRLDVSTPLRYGSAPLYAQFADVWSSVNEDTGVSSYTDSTGPIAAGSYGANGGANSTRTFAIATRESNALAYASPNWGGFNLGARYAHRTAGNGDASANTGREAQNGGNTGAFNNASTGNNLEQDVKRLQLAGTYNKNNLVVGLGYETVSYRDSGVAGQNTVNGGSLTNFNLKDRWQLVAGYDLKVVKLGFLYAQNNLQNTDTSTSITANRDITSTASRNNRSKTTEWGLSVKAPIGAHEVIANYGQADLADDSSAKRIQVQLGYGYNLSVRTRVYAFYQHLVLSNNSSFGITTVGSSVAAPTATGSFVSQPRVDTLSLGIRHNF